MPTLTRLLSSLAEKYDTSKRPSRYFDVRKRGELSNAEVRYVKKRFRELVDREACVERDSSDPSCYDKVTTDLKPKKKKRKSSYLRDYESIYRQDDMSTDAFFKQHRLPRGRGPKGLKRISVETGIPLRELKKVYDIGVGAYASSGSRTGMSAEQWGYGRVYAFIMCYFHNEDGKYDSQRFLKNKTDFQVFLDVVDALNLG